MKQKTGSQSAQRLFAEAMCLPQQDRLWLFDALNENLGDQLFQQQFNLLRQVQIACDTAKGCAARLTGKDAPVHEDNEKTIADAKARIENVVAYLQTHVEKDFAGALERHVSQPRWAGKHPIGSEFALQHAIPNFYFHVTTAYAILRHNGVELGKKDYLGPMPFKESQA